MSPSIWKLCYFTHRNKTSKVNQTYGNLSFFVVVFAISIKFAPFCLFSSPLNFDISLLFSEKKKCLYLFESCVILHIEIIRVKVNQNYGYLSSFFLFFFFAISDHFERVFFRFTSRGVRFGPEMGQMPSSGTNPDLFFLDQMFWMPDTIKRNLIRKFSN